MGPRQVVEPRVTLAVVLIRSDTGALGLKPVRRPLPR
jgi:hypothetical protein